jgi:myo-inositol 2-dehydrogenase / D-chiro-inositol 1-dehydrogenase
MERRHFLVTSATAAQAVLAQSPNDRVGTALIGAGNRGSYLLQSILAQPNAKVTALCELNAERLDKAASTAGKDNPFTTKEWRSVLERKDVDSVFVATPPHLHSEMAVAALEAGKNVYCEKPIGVTPAQVRAVVRAAKRSKKVFVAGQQLRSVGQLAAAVGKIHGGAMGEIYMIKAQRHAPADLPHDGSSAEWYFDVAKSGGYLIEQSVHNLDLCNWVINAHPVLACGFGGNMRYKDDPKGRSIFDNGSIVYEYPRGVKMTFTQNVFHPRQMPNGNQLIYIFGEKGGVDLMYSTNFYPHTAQGQQAEIVPLAEKVQDPPHAHTKAFYDLVAGGTRNPADIFAGATAALTAILGHEAMAKERIVTWEELGVEL